MKELFDKVALDCSKLTTKSYSTSFSLGIRMLDKKFRAPIYSLYGFVRFADEIVDTFHDYDKQELLETFKKDTYDSISKGISLNPILHSFQKVVNDYNIDHELIDAFLHSMALDLDKNAYDQNGYEEYIYGSAEVVGLMCLAVFVEGNISEYERLKPYARALGSAFQKINFLRDFNDDYKGKGRVYFPGLEINDFNEHTKREIEADIEKDFSKGLEGIKMLPKGSRFGVYVAYIYYSALLKKVTTKSVSDILKDRVRISDSQKLALLFNAYIKHQFNLI